MTESLRRGLYKPLEATLSRLVIEAVAERLKHEPQVWQALAYRFPQAGHDMQPDAAGLLHAAKIGWAPPRRRRLNLADAHLRSVVWPFLNLSGASLKLARFGGSNLPSTTPTTLTSSAAAEPYSAIAGVRAAGSVLISLREMILTRSVRSTLMGPGCKSRIDCPTAMSRCQPECALSGSASADDAGAQRPVQCGELPFARRVFSANWRLTG